MQLAISSKSLVLGVAMLGSAQNLMAMAATSEAALASLELPSASYQLEQSPAPFAHLANPPRSSVLSHASFNDRLSERIADEPFAPEHMTSVFSAPPPAPASGDWPKYLAGVGLIGFLLGRRAGFV